VALCTVADVRIHANPASVSDLEITGIIASVTTGVLTKSGAINASIPSIYQAIVHGAAAVTLKRARVNGELASSVETPESKIQNPDIKEEIKYHEEESNFYLQIYRMSSFSSSGFSPSGRMGYKTVNNME